MRKFWRSAYAEGNHFSSHDIGELMTCVGLCLTVFKSYFGVDFVRYQDWNETSITNVDVWFDAFVDDEGVDPDHNRKHLRRITPSELVAAGFEEKFPVKKSDIDDVIELVTLCLQERVLRAA